MLSDRIIKLFQLLQCTNTDIARFAGCTPSNISRLKNGSRDVGPDSRSVQRLVEGVYRYADYENMLSVLCELCATNDRQAETLIPALLDWLYEESDFTPAHTLMPKSKRAQEMRLRNFGERLDQIMTLLDLSNNNLAALLNVDDSLISRYRNGIYHPNRNERIKEKLSETLLLYAEKKDLNSKLAELCGVNVRDLTAEALADWLFGAEENSASTFVESLFRSINMFTPRITFPDSPDVMLSDAPANLTSQTTAHTTADTPLRDRTLSDSLTVPTPQDAENQDCYWGTEGLRRAVIRFLTNAAREGGELLLYSDEPMDWMVGDSTYFAQWASLMVDCVRSGVHIKIIHNLDRSGTEMVSAISGWFPLYISGMIEPYIFRKMKHPRFYHTVFLRPNGEAILGFFPAEIGEKRWYGYISDKRQLEALTTGFHAMLSEASPFLKTYPVSQSDTFRRFYMNIQTDKCVSLLSGLSIGTMPRDLLMQILDRSHITGPSRDEILAVHRMRQQKLLDLLSFTSVDEVVCLPDRETVRHGKAKVNLSAEMIEIPVYYTPEEYAAHASAVLKLVNREKNYHLTLLPQIPFLDLQVCVMHDMAAVMRCREPYAAFVFTNRMLSDSVRDYADTLISRYAADRDSTMEALRKNC